MLDKNAVQNIKAAIRTLSKTAMQALSVYDPEEYGADLAEEMENTAQAVCRYYELDDSVMQEYEGMGETQIFTVNIFYPDYPDKSKEDEL